MLRRNMTAFPLVLVLVSSSAQAAEKPPPDVPPCPSGQEKPDIAALVRRTQQMLEGASSVATMSMSIRTKAWSRKLKMKVWTRGRDYALIRVLEGGPRETGLMTLKREKQLWNYLPQAGRVMKLPSGMMGDSWMGSDFTNDDLVKGSSLADDYDAKVLEILRREASEAWRVELTPKKDAAVVWGRVELVVDRKTCLPLEQVFFDEDGKQARRMAFGDFKRVGWRDFPARMVVTPADSARETAVVYEEIEFDTPVADDTFSLRRLEAGR